MTTRPTSTLARVATRNGNGPRVPRHTEPKHRADFLPADAERSIPFCCGRHLGRAS